MRSRRNWRGCSAAIGNRLGFVWRSGIGRTAAIEGHSGHWTRTEPGTMMACGNAGAIPGYHSGAEAAGHCSKTRIGSGPQIGRALVAGADNDSARLPMQRGPQISVTRSHRRTFSEGACRFIIVPLRNGVPGDWPGAHRLTSVRRALRSRLPIKRQSAWAP